MHFTIILAASGLVRYANAHGGVPGAPKIVGLASNDVAALRSRNILGGRAAHFAHGSHGLHAYARQDDSEGRCGKDFSCKVCAADECCSSGGWCKS